ncbi:hypothetical protein SPOG_01451 [Schizosaccharomyces cryophilus OY26]|uniref:Uncharacterized protein n=1 Tax=Schizosaccharomyces cryophilus (strain OY26 / ATCC MYA-4695 / CBS 11777 / NBRC 106824 / NRRL Y48691) TaxID=653667 RepID=S9X712_SCHCR|nr:uncharacterized protein SPOG_01451 [Schizosaccharomyces cryophilus OY26]EPY49566.1 hypothetical protein SPOG_01451 [Schizosaccharomyces cryophilus OY26]
MEDRIVDKLDEKMDASDLSNVMENEDVNPEVIKTGETKVARGTETLNYDMKNSSFSPSMTRTTSDGTVTLKQIRAFQSNNPGFSSANCSSPVHTKAEEPGLGLTPMNSRDYSNKIANRYKL